jgi:hypothetical protein
MPVYHEAGDAAGIEVIEADILNRLRARLKPVQPGDERLERLGVVMIV